jgi:hypothetical protein
MSSADSKDKKKATRKPPISFAGRKYYGLFEPPPAARAMPPTTAAAATRAMMVLPPSSFDFLLVAVTARLALTACATESFAAGLAVAAETAIGVARRPAAAIEAMAIFTVFIVGLLKLECEREFTWLYWPESLIKSTPLGDRLPILSVAAHNSTKNREIFCETRHVYRQEIPRIRLK